MAVHHRSADARIFETIGTVTAAGNSQTNRTYSFPDPGVPSKGTPTIYYRLKIVDFDGTFTYSNIEEMQWEANAGTFLQVYPNPGKDNVQISFFSTNALILNLTAYDMQGREVWKSDRENVAGKQLLSLDVSNWPKGMYLFLLKGGETEVQQRFIKE